MKSEKSYNYDDDEILICINCGYRDEAHVWKKNQDRCIQCQSYCKIVFVKQKNNVQEAKKNERRSKS